MLRNALTSLLNSIRVFLIEAVALVVGIFLMYVFMMHVIVPGLASTFAHMGK